MKIEVYQVAQKPPSFRAGMDSAENKTVLPFRL